MLVCGNRLNRTNCKQIFNQIKKDDESDIDIDEIIESDESDGSDIDINIDNVFDDDIDIDEIIECDSDSDSDSDSDIYI